MAVNKSGILKIAGLSLVGFCAASIGMDRVNAGPIASQFAGFSGALLGGFAAYRRARAASKLPPEPPSWAAEFRRDGYTHFPQLVPAALIEAARETIAENIAQSYDESRLVEYNNRSWCPELRLSPEIANLFKNEAVQSIANTALGKYHYRHDHGQIAIRKAHNSGRASAPVPHIDGIPTSDNGVKGTEIQNFTALVGVFLTEVSLQFSGNFTVWPGSHVLLEQHFKERGQQVLSEGMPAIPLGKSVQLLCKPGDVVLCHYELAHAAAVNTSNDDRIAVFFRLWFKDIAGPRRSGQRWHNLTHLWHGWRI